MTIGAQSQHAQLHFTSGGEEGFKLAVVLIHRSIERKLTSNAQDLRRRKAGGFEERGDMLEITFVVLRRDETIV